MRNRLSENRQVLEPEIKQMGQEAVHVLLQQIYNISETRPCENILTYHFVALYFLIDMMHSSCDLFTNP